LRAGAKPTRDPSWHPAPQLSLKDIPALEETGLIVRVPDWWKASRPPRPVVSVTVGNSTKISANALLDFSVAVTFDGQPLKPVSRTVQQPL